MLREISLAEIPTIFIACVVITITIPNQQIKTHTQAHFLLTHSYFLDINIFK